MALRGEVRSLTGLRILAALWVVFFHYSFTPGDAYTRFWEPLRPLVQVGALGVDLFYVLSGFVITLTYLNKLGPRPTVRSAVGFWWARVCRVWPVYALVTTLFFGWCLYKQSRVTDGFVVWQLRQPVFDVWHWLEQLTMTQLWHRPDFVGASFVGPAWSISAEMAAYAVFPLLALVLWRVRRAPAVVTGALAVLCLVPAAYRYYSVGNYDFEYSWVLRIGLGFLAGAFTCLAVRRLPATPRVERIAAGVAVLVVLEMVLGIWWGGWRGPGEFGGVILPLFPVLVGALAISRSGISRFLATGPMVHGGRISFSLYLLHVPVFEIFWTQMAWRPSLAPGSPLGTFLIPQMPLLVLLLAHVLYTCVEEPARMWMRGRGPGRWARTERKAAELIAAGTRPPVEDAPADVANDLPVGEASAGTARSEPAGVPGRGAVSGPSTRPLSASRDRR